VPMGVHRKCTPSRGRDKAAEHANPPPACWRRGSAPTLKNGSLPAAGSWNRCVESRRARH